MINSTAPRMHIRGAYLCRNKIITTDRAAQQHGPLSYGSPMSWKKDTADSVSGAGRFFCFNQGFAEGFTAT